MFKKMTALIATMWTIPFKASSFSDVPFFNADFSSGSFNDLAGGAEGEEAYSGEVQRAEFVQNNAIGRQVLRFHGQSALFYTGFDYSKIQSNFTMEAYVSLDDVQKNMAFLETAGSALHLKQYNDNLNAYVGFRAGDIFSLADYCYTGSSSYVARNAYTEQGQILPSGKWVHLVGTFDAHTTKFYVNGRLMASVAREYHPLNMPDFVNEEYANLLMIGDSLMGNAAFQGKLAFARIYEGFVDDAGAAVLYQNRLNHVPKKELPLKIVSTPFKLQYKAGEKLDLTGMQLTIQVEEAEIPVSVDDCIITGFDSERAGDQEIKVVYETEDTIYSAAFTIRVISVTGIGLVTKPAKLYYTYGEALDTTGLSVTVHYSDGSVGYVSEGLEVTGYDALVSGVQRLTVTYQGKATNFSVKVLNN